jgi:hypothetical protein
MEATFTTLGGCLAWLEVRRPAPFHVLFVGRLTEGGGCLSQSLLLLPRVASLWQAAALMPVVLGRDVPILERLQFAPGFVEADDVLRAFVEVVESLPEETRGKVEAGRRRAPECTPTPS